jgi:hypothetical protein
MRLVVSLSLCPESVTICICSRQRQLGQSFFIVFCEQHFSTGSFAQQDLGLAGTSHVFCWQTPEAILAAGFGPPGLQQQGIRDAGTIVTPTSDMHERMMIK